MDLTPREKDKLMIFTAALLAKQRKERGVKLNYPEAIAFISAEILEGARDGKSVAEMMEYGRELVTIHNPIQQTKSTFDGTSEKDTIVPGEILVDLSNEIEININRERIKVVVSNHGDRPIQVGSHYHFYETNSALSFDRDKTKGFRLNIPSGTAVRFEPGQEREVELVKYDGKNEIYGFNAKVMGPE